jgi:hypothetical protein
MKKRTRSPTRVTMRLRRPRGRPLRGMLTPNEIVNLPISNKVSYTLKVYRNAYYAAMQFFAGEHFQIDVREFLNIGRILTKGDDLSLHRVARRSRPASKQ